MRLVLQALGRSAVALALGSLVVACPTPQSPKGPPPEYEEPPAPSWLDGGAGAEASAPPPAARVAPAAPAPGDAGAGAPQYIAP
jgi:hypothetical protein